MSAGRRGWPRPLVLTAVAGLVAGGVVAGAGPTPALAAGRAPRERGGAPVSGTIEDPGGHALDRLFEDLRRAERGAADGRAAIVEIGDSHTAADSFTGRLRERLQRRFGDAGRGYLLPGKPPKHYYQHDAAYGATGPWEFEDGRRPTAVEPFGLFGLRFRASSPDAVAWVETCSGDKCRAGQRVARFEIVYRLLQGGGRLTYQVDAGPWEDLDTRPAASADAAAPVTGLKVVSVPDGPHRLTMRPVGDGPVELFGVALERNPPGVVVDAVGVVGARAAHLHAWDWSAIGPQLGMREPSLVILQYGTNETDQRDLDLGRLEQQFVELVARVRQAAPGASVLILGPPDRGVRERRGCDRLVRRARARARRDHQASVKTPRGCAWRTPQVLLDVIEAERRAAQRSGAAFFDTFAAMGGPGRMDGWQRQDPPLAAKDHAHLTARGYEWAADLFLDALLPQYERWLRTAGAAPRRGLTP